MKRVFLIVLDSLGIGAAPDARDFGDEGTNTLRSLYRTGILNIPNLIKLGIGNIDGIDYLEKADSHRATVCRLRELSRGKDTTIGHWEIAGIVSESAMPTYPDGFPSEIIETFESAIGRKTLCNKVYSGTEVIKDYGEEHIKTGMPIIYTSADSVFQIAAHEDIIPIDTLYEYCREARKILTGKHAVGRVIARPFITADGKFKRTANRHDFSLTPPRKNLLNAISDSGLEVISVGKINDIFAGYGITSSNPSLSNSDGMRIASDIQKKDFSGLAFINLVDFDSSYGHRQDALGYTEALNEFDAWLGEFIKGLSDDDMLIITADHGCDPSDDSTDHTREYVPLLVYNRGRKPHNLGTHSGFTLVSRIIAEELKINFTPEAQRGDIK